MVAVLDKSAEQYLRHHAQFGPESVQDVARTYLSHAGAADPEYLRAVAQRLRQYGHTCTAHLLDGQGQ